MKSYTSKPLEIFQRQPRGFRYENLNSKFLVFVLALLHLRYVMAGAKGQLNLNDQLSHFK